MMERDDAGNDEPEQVMTSTPVSEPQAKTRMDLCADGRAQVHPGLR
jgi:hypothetical protein